jgi:hypothetical protein
MAQLQLLIESLRLNRVVEALRSFKAIQEMPQPQESSRLGSRGGTRPMLAPPNHASKEKRATLKVARVKTLDN